MRNPHNAPISPFTQCPGWETLHEQGLLLSLASGFAVAPKDVTIVEIGSQFGMSASLFALASEGADIVCIEIDDKAPFMANLKEVDLEAWVNPVFEDSRQVNWPKVAKDLQIDIRISLLFVDGDHSYQGAKADLLKFSHYVKRGGIIAIHDCACTTNLNPHPAHIEVYTAVQHWLQETGHEQGYHHMCSVDSTMVFRRMK